MLQVDSYSSNQESIMIKITCRGKGVGTESNSTQLFLLGVTNRNGYLESLSIGYCEISRSSAILSE